MADGRLGIVRGALKQMTKKITRNFPEFFYNIKKLEYSPAICIDVGAASGTPSIYRAFPDAYHIVFEPLDDFQADLKKSLGDCRHEIHQCGLMDKPGEMELLRIQSNLYTSSLMHKRKQGEKGLVTVPIRTLDDVLKDKDLSGGVLLKTDCQGSDLFVIQGATKVLESTDIVILETSFFKFWGDHHPDFFEIVSYMKDQGFVVYDILDGLFRPFDKALGQIDLVFVKEHGRFRRSHQW